MPRPVYPDLAPSNLRETFDRWYVCTSTSWLSPIAAMSCLRRIDRLEFAAAADDATLVAVELHAAVDDPDFVLVVSTFPIQDHLVRGCQCGGWERIRDETQHLLATSPEEHVCQLVDSPRTRSRRRSGYRNVGARPERGEVVAVTGDGVNDATALRRADVGVAMGHSGSEAAREAAAIVLTDDDFATIIAAIEAGRRIGDNIRKFVAFLLSANLGEVLVFTVAIIGGFGAPLAVVQVLLVNLVTDGLPALALGQDPASAETMRSGPRRGTRLFDHRQWLALGCIGLLVGSVTFAAFLALADRGIPPATQLPPREDVPQLERKRLVGSWRATRIRGESLLPGSEDGRGQSGSFIS